jgi:MFS family permease
MPVSPRLISLQGLRAYLSAVRGFSRNAGLILSVTAFRGMVIAATSTIFNLYLYSLGYDTRSIGFINASGSLAVLVVSLPFGYLADRVGRKVVLMAGGFAYPALFLLLSLAHSTPAIVLANVALSGVSCAYWVAAVPLLYASTTPEQRVSAFSINSFLLWGVGPLGALMAGEVVELAAAAFHLSSASPAALRTGMYFITVLALAGAVPYPFLREPPSRVEEHSPPPPLGALTRLVVQLLTPDLILAFALGALLTFVQLYFHVRFGLDAGPVGVIVGVGGIISGVGALLTPLIARRWGNLGSAVGIQLITAPLMALVAVAGALWIAIPAFWTMVTLRGMADPVYTAFIQERVPETYRARLTGFYSVTYSVGASLGPAVSGELQKSGGFTLAFLVAAACYTAGAVLLFLFFRGRPVPAP